jgi:outer membrane protein assembly factor BamB
MKAFCLTMTAWFYGLFALATCGVATAQDWPQWRGPNRDGMVAAISIPQIWPSSLKLKWKAEVGAGHSSPVVAKGKVYLFSRQDNNEVVSCFSLDAGKLLWRKDYPAPYSMNFAAYAHGKGPKSTPALHDGKLYTLGISGILSCFEAETGNLLWRKEFSKKFAKTSPLYGVAMSPLVEGNLLVVHVGGHDQGALVAFDAKTGETKWSWEGDGPGYASPIAVEIDGTRQIVTQTQNYIVGVDANSGKLLWSIPFTTDYDQNIVTPVIHKSTAETRLIFSGLDKGTMAVKVSKRGNEWAIVEIWKNPEASMYLNSPVVNGDRLFGLSHLRKGQFFCLDVRNGKTLWTSEGRQGDNAAILSAGDFLFFLTNEAEMIVAKASAKAFEPVAKYSVADGDTWAHPVVLGKQILIKDASTLALWSID